MPANVPLSGPRGLICQLGISEHLRQRDFRRQIGHWLKVIQQLWPRCPVMLRETQGCLLVKPTKRSSPQFTTAS